MLFSDILMPTASGSGLLISPGSILLIIVHCII